MDARALICDEKQQFSLQDVILPDPGPDNLVIRTAYTGVSIGTEMALVRKKISWGPYPLCTGYMGTGVVEHVGANIHDYAVGDRVFFRANGPMQLKSGEKVSTVTGGHCSHMVIEDKVAHGTHGLDHLPGDAPMDITAMFAVAAVGHFGTDMAEPHYGQHVVVYGAGLIGLSVIAACVTRGCVVTAIDINPRALAIAAKMGADHLINPKERNALEEVRKITPAGADVVFESTGLPQLIDPAIELCKGFGSFVWQGNYGSEPITMKFLPAHGRRLKMFFPCDDGGPACRRAVVKNMARGALPWQHTITHRIPHTEAPAVYDAINKNAPEYLGVLIQWS
jgi:2-desacetyl-2-hydroxyethyl bacteriochlorophyllide A dehydrogenase